MGNESFAVVLEREAELEALSGAVSALVGGVGGLVAVEGRPGEGKSTLLDRSRRLAAAADCRWLHAVGMGLERELGWSTVTALLGPVVTQSSAGRALLADAAAPVRALFGLEESALSVRATLQSLIWLVEDLAGQGPLVVAVDDFQWVDELSARFLSLIAHRAAELPVLVVLASRPQPTSVAWQAVTAVAGARVLTLSPLSRAGSAAVVAASLGTAPGADFADACHETTGGNPFLLRELVRQVAATAAQPDRRPSAEQVRNLRPGAVERAVLRRLTELGDPAMRLAFAIAVLGPHATLPRAGTLCGLSGDALARQADALAAADLVRVEPTLGFVHPIVAGVIGDGVPPATRRDWQRRTASILRCGGAPAEEIALHLVEAEPTGDPEVVAILAQAGREAAGVGASATAARFLRRALLEPPDPEEAPALLWQLAQAEVTEGPAVAVPRYRQALAATDDPLRRAEITLELSEQLVLQAEIAEAIDLCRAARGALAPSARELRLRIDATEVALGAFDVARRQRLPEGIAELPGESPGERLLLAASANAMMVDGTYPMPTIATLAVRAFGAGKLLDEVPLTNTLLWSVASALTVAEAHAQAAKAIEQAQEMARRASSPEAFALSCCFRAALHFRLGRLPDAVADGQRAIELLDPSETALAYLYSLGFLTNALVARGELEEAERRLAGMALEATPPLVVFGLLLGARGRLRAAQGRFEEAKADLLGAGDRLGSVSAGVLPWRAEAAIVLARLGDRSRGVALAAEDRRRSALAQSVWAQAIALRATAVVTGEAAPLEEAEALTRGGGAPLERARILVELGALHRRAGRGEAAQTVLRQGLDVADRCGAAPLAERARSELRATGARPRRGRLSGQESLTPSERRVSELAASGRSNREIAQALFIGLRTVETHLTHTFRKLSISSRAELAEALGEATSEPS